VRYSGGDIIRVALDPTKGTEQTGTRPVLVISEAVVAGSRIIVVPFTSTNYDAPHLYRMTVGDQESTAMCDQVRAIDAVSGRVKGYVGTASYADLRAVREIVARLIGIY